VIERQQQNLGGGAVEILTVECPLTDWAVTREIFRNGGKVKNTGKDGIEIIAQLTGMKNHAIEDGWRITFDLFGSRERDAMMIMSLVNTKETVKLKILPLSKDDLKRMGC
jgi:hypothetical protein